jgi:hypothetical protein
MTVFLLEFFKLYLYENFSQLRRQPLNTGLQSCLQLVLPMYLKRLYSGLTATYAFTFSYF